MPISNARIRAIAPAHPHAQCRRIAGVVIAGLLGACSLLQEPPAPVPVAVVAPKPAPLPEPVAPQPDPADLAARHLLAYHERLRLMTPADLAADIAQRSALIPSADGTAPPDAVIALALALAQQHNAGDLARAASLLEPIVQSTNPALQPWQPLANLLGARIGEQRRLEDQLEHQSAQLRDAQRAMQQLTEKLEALKAIERSMTTRSALPGGVGAENAPAAKAP